MAFAHVAETMKDASHTQSHCSLAGARVAGEGHVQRGRIGGQPDFLTRARHQKKRRYLANAVLDWREAD